MFQAAQRNQTYCMVLRQLFCLNNPYHPYHRWEDSLNAGTGGRSVTRSNSIPALNPRQTGGRGSRGRGGQYGSRTANTTFMSATGDPISGRRCYTCGDPSHFANVCPHRGV